MTFDELIVWLKRIDLWWEDSEELVEKLFDKFGRIMTEEEQEVMDNIIKDMIIAVAWDLIDLILD